MQRQDFQPKPLKLTNIIVLSEHFCPELIRCVVTKMQKTFSVERMLIAEASINSLKFNF